ncbi:hypothetical protein J2T17_001839 [Paenibacillus mucilaginosus]
MKATFMQSITERKKICPSVEGAGMHDWKARRYLFESDLYVKHNGAQKDMPERRYARARSVHSIASLRLRYWTGVMP